MKGPKYQIGSGSQKIVLAIYCEECGGEGKRTKETKSGLDLEEVTCGACDGFGFLTTQNGAQILALVNDVLIKRSK